MAPSTAMLRAMPWCRRILGTGCLLLVVAVGLVVVPAGQRLEELAGASVTLPWPRSIPVYHVLAPVGPVLVAVVLLGSVLLGLVRRRLDLALSACLVVVGANVATWLAKRVLLRPDLGADSIGMGNTTPSGHTTAAFTFAVALLLALPRVLRLPAVALGAAGTTVAGLGMVVTGHHRPGDVVGAVGLGLVVAAPAVALGRRVRRRLGGTSCAGLVAGHDLGTDHLRTSWLVRPAVLLAAALAGALFTVARVWCHGVEVGPGPGRSVLGVLVVVLVAAVSAGAVALVAHAVDRTDRPGD